MTNVTIPKSVTGIGSCAFDGCINITKIEIPSSVKGIGENAFSYCSSLTEISVSNKNTAYSSKDGALFTKDKKWLIQYPLGNERTSYNIPDSVENTEPFAFADCKNLKNLTLSNKMTSINYCAFYNCHSLINVTMPSSVTSIDESAFESCTNLKYIVIPSKVKYIGTDAFLDCTNLTEIYYPNSKSKLEKINEDGIKNVTVYFDSTLNEKQKTGECKKITPANASLTITWEKVNGVKGYEVQLATDKKFKKNKKTITVNNQKTTVKKLKSNKKYYVRIRTYKMSKGTKVYSSWSKVKSIKTK